MPPPSETPVPLGWLERTDVPAGPSAREDHTWTVNGDETVAYLFGGRGAGGASGELWAFDLATDSWSQLVQTVDTPIPAARFGHTATWVPDVGLVIWSGQSNSGFFDDIWAMNPDAVPMWTQLSSLGSVPAARYGSCASLGPDGELWISHGFTEDSGRFSDTRSYNFRTGTWTDRTPLDRVPVERCLHDCFWSAGGRLILYGGQTTGVPALGDIWTFDPEAGRWEEGIQQAAPPRQLYALASDPQLGILVFGGGSVDGGFLDDTWALDWGGPQLHAFEVVAGPSARAGATLIGDAAGRYLLFGGTNAEGVLGDLWELGPSN